MAFSMINQLRIISFVKSLSYIGIHSINLSENKSITCGCQRSALAASYLNPLPDMPILGSPNSAANKDRLKI